MENTNAPRRTDGSNGKANRGRGGKKIGKLKGKGKGKAKVVVSNVPKKKAQINNTQQKSKIETKKQTTQQFNQTGINIKNANKIPSQAGNLPINTGKVKSQIKRNNTNQGLSIEESDNKNKEINPTTRNLISSKGVGNTSLQSDQVKKNVIIESTNVIKPLVTKVTSNNLHNQVDLKRESMVKRPSIALHSQINQSQETKSHAQLNVDNPNSNETIDSTIASRTRSSCPPGAHDQLLDPVVIHAKKRKIQEEQLLDSTYIPPAKKQTTTKIEESIVSNEPLTKGPIDAITKNTANETMVNSDETQQGDNIIPENKIMAFGTENHPSDDHTLYITDSIKYEDEVIEQEFPSITDSSAQVDRSPEQIPDNPIQEQQSHQESQLAKDISVEYTTTTEIPKKPTPNPLSWGASFGQVESSDQTKLDILPVKLSSIPLSSWILSRGEANFKKQVVFPGGNTTLGESFINTDGDPSYPQSSNANFVSLLPHGKSKKRLLQQPIKHIPQEVLEFNKNLKGKNYLSRETILSDLSSAPRKNQLEQLELLLQSEKQKNNEFSHDLWEMLKGKSITGKEFEQEYSHLLQRKS